MIHCLCKFIVSWLIRQNYLANKYEQWAIYVLEFRIQEAIGLFSVLIIGCFITSFTSALAFLVSLRLINSRSGGYHCSSFEKCFILTLFSSIGFLSLSKCFIFYPPYISLFTTIISTILLHPAPLNNTRIQLSENELNENRKKLRQNQIFLTIVIIIFTVLKSDLSVFLSQGYLSSALAIALQLIYIHFRRYKQQHVK